MVGKNWVLIRQAGRMTFLTKAAKEKLFYMKHNSKGLLDCEFFCHSIWAPARSEEEYICRLTHRDTFHIDNCH